MWQITTAYQQLQTHPGWALRRNPYANSKPRRALYLLSMVLMILAASTKAIKAEMEATTDYTASEGPMPLYMTSYITAAGSSGPNPEDYNQRISQDWIHLNHSEVVDDKKCLYKATFGFEPVIDGNDDASTLKTSQNANFTQFEGLCQHRAANMTDLDAVNPSFWHPHDSPDLGVKTDKRDECCTKSTASVQFLPTELIFWFDKDENQAIMLPYFKQVKQFDTVEDSVNDNEKVDTYHVQLNWQNELTPKTFLGTESKYYSERCLTNVLSIYYKLDKCSHQSNDKLFDADTIEEDATADEIISDFSQKCTTLELAKQISKMAAFDFQSVHMMANEQEKTINLPSIDWSTIPQSCIKQFKVQVQAKDKNNSQRGITLKTKSIQASFIIGDIRNSLSSPQLIIRKTNIPNSLTQHKQSFVLSLKVSNSLDEEEVIANFATVDLINERSHRRQPRELSTCSTVDSFVVDNSSSSYYTYSILTSTTGSSGYGARVSYGQYVQTIFTQVPTFQSYNSATATYDPVEFLTNVDSSSNCCYDIVYELECTGYQNCFGSDEIKIIGSNVNNPSVAICIDSSNSYYSGQQFEYNVKATLKQHATTPSTDLSTNLDTIRFNYQYSDHDLCKNNTWANDGNYCPFVNDEIPKCEGIRACNAANIQSMSVDTSMLSQSQYSIRTIMSSSMQEQAFQYSTSTYWYDRDYYSCEYMASQHFPAQPSIQINSNDASFDARNCYSNLKYRLDCECLASATCTPTAQVGEQDMQCEYMNSNGMSQPTLDTARNSFNDNIYIGIEPDQNDSSNTKFSYRLKLELYQNGAKTQEASVGPSIDISTTYNSMACSSMETVMFSEIPMNIMGFEMQSDSFQSFYKCDNNQLVEVQSSDWVQAYDHTLIDRSTCTFYSSMSLNRQDGSTDFINADILNSDLYTEPFWTGNSLLQLYSAEYYYYQVYNATVGDRTQELYMQFSQESMYSYGSGSSGTSSNGGYNQASQESYYSQMSSGSLMHSQGMSQQIDMYCPGQTQRIDVNFYFQEYTDGYYAPRLASIGFTNGDNSYMYCYDQNTVPYLSNEKGKFTGQFKIQDNSNLILQGTQSHYYDTTNWYANKFGVYYKMIDSMCSTSATQICTNDQLKTHLEAMFASYFASATATAAGYTQDAAGKYVKNVIYADGLNDLGSGISFPNMMRQQYISSQSCYVYNPQLELDFSVNTGTSLSTSVKQWTTTNTGSTFNFALASLVTAATEVTLKLTAKVDQTSASVEVDIATYNFEFDGCEFANAKPSSQSSYLYDFVSTENTIISLNTGAVDSDFVTGSGCGTNFRVDYGCTQYAPQVNGVANPDLCANRTQSWERMDYKITIEAGLDESVFINTSTSTFSVFVLQMSAYIVNTSTGAFSDSIPAMMVVLDFRNEFCDQQSLSSFQKPASFPVYQAKTYNLFQADKDIFSIVKGQVLNYVDFANTASRDCNQTYAYSFHLHGQSSTPIQSQYSQYFQEDNSSSSEQILQIIGDTALQSSGETTFLISYKVEVSHTEQCSGLCGSFVSDEYITLTINYQCDSTAVFTNYPDLAASSYLKREIAVTYILTDTKHEEDLPVFATNPDYCAVDYIVTYQSQSTEVVQLDSSSRKIKVFYEDGLDIVQNNDQIDVTYTVSINISTTTKTMELDTYIFTLVNPCVLSAYSNITGPSNSTYSYTIGQGSQTYSVESGLSGSIAFCGSVSARITSVYDSTIVVDVDQSGATINTYDTNQNGRTLELVFETYLTNYPQITGEDYTIYVNLADENQSSNTVLEEFIEEATANIIAGGLVVEEEAKPFFQNLGQNPVPYEFDRYVEGNQIVEKNLGPLLNKLPNSVIVVTQADDPGVTLQYLAEQNSGQLIVDMAAVTPGEHRSTLMVQSQNQSQYLVITVRIFDTTPNEPNSNSTSSIEVLENDQETIDAVNSTGLDSDIKQQETFEVTETKQQKLAGGVTITTTTVTTKVKEEFKHNGKTVAEMAPAEKVAAYKSIQEHNKKVEKPYVKKISAGGKFKINLDDKRMQEWPVDEPIPTTLRRELQEVSDGSLSLGLNLGSTEPKKTIDGKPSSGEEIPGVKMYVETFEENDHDLNFDYNITTTATNIDVQLKFKKPSGVSVSEEKDILVIELNDLRDNEGNLVVKENRIVNEIPNQVSPELAASLETAGNAVSSSVGASFSANFIIQLLMAASIAQMVSSIKFLQVIVHSSLLNVIVPGNAAILFGAVAEQISFDPIDLSEQINKMYGIVEQQEELASNLVDLGYETPYFVTNLGILLYVVKLEIGVVIILIILYFLTLCGARFERFAKKQLDKVFFNTILAFIDGTFLVIVFMGLINIQQAQEGKVPINESYWMAVTFLTLYALELLALMFFFCCCFKMLDNDQTKMRCGYVYENLNYKIHGRAPLMYPIIYQVRFAVLVWLALFMQEYMAVQILIFSLMTILTMTVLGTVNPFKDSEENYSQIFFEFVILINMDLLMFSTDRLINGEFRMALGWSMIALLGVAILYSQGRLLYNSGRHIYRQLYLLKLRQVVARVMKERQEKALEKIIQQKENQINDQELVENGGGPMPSPHVLDPEHIVDKMKSRRPKIKVEKDDIEQQQQQEDGEQQFGGLNLEPMMTQVDEVLEDEDGQFSSSRSKRQGEIDEECVGCRMRMDAGNPGKCILCQLKEVGRQPVQEANQENNEVQQDDGDDEPREIFGVPLEISSDEDYQYMKEEAKKEEQPSQYRNQAERPQGRGSNFHARRFKSHFQIQD